MAIHPKSTMMFLGYVFLIGSLVLLSSADPGIYDDSHLNYFNYTDIQGTNKEFKVNYKTHEKNSDQSIIFSLCGPVESRCKDKDSMAVIIPKNHSDFQVDCNNAQEFDVMTHFIPFDKSSDEEEHLKLIYNTRNKGYFEKDGTFRNDTYIENYKMQIEVFCDRTMTVYDEPKITTNDIEPDADVCHPKIYVRSIFGGRVSNIETVHIFFDTYYWAFSIVFICFGVYNIFLGARMFKKTIMLFGCFSMVALVYFLLFFVFEIEEPASWIMWLIILSAASVGLVIGYFMMRIFRVGVCVIGGWTGFILALLLDSFIFSKLHIAFLEYLLYIIFVPGMGFVAYKYYEYVLIFSTAILGSYFFVRGISLLIGGYPSEIELLEQLRHRTVMHIPWTFYIYLLAMIIFSVLGVYYQVKSSKNKNKKKKRKVKVKKREEPSESTKNKQYDEFEEEVSES